MICRPPTARRSGAAAVEFAVIMNFVLVPLMIGTWEMGRVIFIQQVLSNAAREGARLAAQGLTINDNGTQTLIQTAIDPASNTARAPNVKASVFQTMRGAGLNQLGWNDVTVAFAFIDSPSGAVAGATQPYQGVKGQKFTVQVTLNSDALAKVKWSGLGLVNPTSLGYTVQWQMLVDDPFTVNTNIPGW